MPEDIHHCYLLLHTPDVNPARTMRHINGLDTRRRNRLKGIDGPLYRGRYKAILVDANQHLLPVSRYIHRHPIEAKRPLGVAPGGPVLVELCGVY